MKNKWKKGIHSDGDLLTIQGRQLSKVLDGVEILLKALETYAEGKARPHIAKNAIKRYKEITSIGGENALVGN